MLLESYYYFKKWETVPNLDSPSGPMLNKEYMLNPRCVIDPWAKQAVNKRYVWPRATRGLIFIRVLVREGYIFWKIKTAIFANIRAFVTVFLVNCWKSELSSNRLLFLEIPRLIINNPNRFFLIFCLIFETRELWISLSYCWIPLGNRLELKTPSLGTAKPMPGDASKHKSNRDTRIFICYGKDSSTLKELQLW